MTIGTWNVNGIRARQSQVQEWVRRDRPDVVCLQEIKAGSDQVPTALCEMEDYWCYWHGAKGYSGVGLHVSKAFSAERPVFAHPAFDYESRIVTTEIGGVTVASVYVPNGGKDFDAKMRFLEAMDAFVVQAHAEGKRLVICGDFNIARADIDVHPKERKPRAIGQLPEERAILERLLGRGLVDTGGRSTRRTTRCSPGGRRGGTCASATSDGGSTTSWQARRFSMVSATCSVDRDFGTSDHAPVVARFDV